MGEKNKGGWSQLDMTERVTPPADIWPVFFLVAFLTQRFQVIKVQCYGRILQVVRREPDFVVNMFRWHSAAFA